MPRVIRNGPRKRAEVEPPDPHALPLDEAARLEIEGAWPDWRDSRRFWSRPEVPEDLRSGSEPDPRPILADPDLGPEIEAARKELTERRTAWLMEVTSWHE